MGPEYPPKCFCCSVHIKSSVGLEITFRGVDLVQAEGRAQHLHVRSELLRERVNDLARGSAAAHAQARCGGAGRGAVFEVEAHHAAELEVLVEGSPMTT